MKVLNLRCGQGHGFEGWFASDDEYEAQCLQGLVTCPACGDGHPVRLPTAPRLNLSASRSSRAGGAPAASSAPAAAPVATLPEQVQAAWLQAVAQVLARTEDVGQRFPEEARRIHYGEAPERGIRGVATPDEREALLEEGIEIVPLPVPEALKGPLQ